MKRFKLPKFTKLQLAAHIAALVPLAWLVWDYFNNNLTVNPIQAATQRTGLYALSLLIASLAITPIQTISGFNEINKLRRPFGLYAFMYAAIHLSIFVGVDYGFAWDLLLLDTVEKRFVWVGLAAFLILSALAFTSYRYWMKKLGKAWKRLHRLVYGAALLVILHFAWVVKGDVTRLSGEIIQPVLFGLGVIVLLLLRVPAVKKAIVNLRQKSKRVGQASSTGRQKTNGHVRPENQWPVQSLEKIEREKP